MRGFAEGLAMTLGQRVGREATSERDAGLPRSDLKPLVGRPDGLAGQPSEAIEAADVAMTEAPAAGVCETAATP